MRQGGERHELRLERNCGIVGAQACAELGGAGPRVGAPVLVLILVLAALGMWLVTWAIGLNQGDVPGITQ